MEQIRKRNFDDQERSKSVWIPSDFEMNDPWCLSLYPFMDTFLHQKSRGFLYTQDMYVSVLHGFD